MFDVGFDELLVIAIVAIVVIGPKDLPKALRLAGRWIAKVRRVSGHFRSGIEAMIREAELEEMDKQWREQNEKIMAQYPADPGTGHDPDSAPAMEPITPPDDVAAGDATSEKSEEPSLPFDGAQREG